MCKRRVLVIGSINRDELLEVDRLPSPGETVSSVSTSTMLGGKGANQAVAAARAGARVRMVGAVGKSEGKALIDELGQYGIDTDGVGRQEVTTTGRAVVIVDARGENCIVHVPGANDAIQPGSVMEACSTLESGDVLILQNEIPVSVSQEAAKLAHTRNARVVWNAAPAPSTRNELISHVDVLVVNQHELEIVATLLGQVGSNIRENAVNVSNDLGVELVCTLGAEGAVRVAGDLVDHVPAAVVDVQDSIAAGDTFVGFLSAHEGASDDLRLALAAGSLSVTRAGSTGSIPDLDEVRQFIATTTPK